jgi:hypothetical protein
MSRFCPIACCSFLYLYRLWRNYFNLYCNYTKLTNLASWWAKARFGDIGDLGYIVCTQTQTYMNREVCSYNFATILQKEKLVENVPKLQTHSQFPKSKLFWLAFMIADIWFWNLLRRPSGIKKVDYLVFWHENSDGQAMLPKTTISEGSPYIKKRISAKHFLYKIAVTVHRLSCTKSNLKEKNWKNDQELDEQRKRPLNLLTLVRMAI